MEMKKCVLCARPRTKNSIRICDYCQKRIIDEMMFDDPYSFCVFWRTGVDLIED